MLTELERSWSTALTAQLPDAAVLRRQLHADPRVSGDEADTLATVARALGVDLEPVAQHGGVGRVGPSAGPSIAVRGELDALPLQEATGVEFASTNGSMHACGHDVHLAALVALVRAADNVELPYGLVPMLQPREETYPSGAKEIAESGLLRRFGVGHAVGAHVHPAVPAGAVAIGEGFVNAAAGEIEIVLTGRGGHGAYPHQGADVAVAVSQVVTGLSEVVRRTADPMDPTMISVGTIHVGSGAANVLPGEGRVLCTVRTVSDAEGTRLATAVGHYADGIAAAFGCQARTEYTRGEPSLINDARLARASHGWVQQVGLKVAPPMRSLGADDFSYYGEAVPTLMCFVGVDADPGVGLHHPRFLPDQVSIARVAKAMMAGYLGAAQTIQDQAREEPL
ncbi:M20 family metallopeptidase [Galactobacter sp.]|uniref:M20 metallopeptidase family protein n=1 Tax=Galactobacter sp. TaxID=2676125 RepID=UPI0025B963B9|nr:M20 family metallopeptidase [Galactobacter sp.]